VQRLHSRYNNLIVIHLPVHASWLNQLEICFSVVQRKVLIPNDLTSLSEVPQRLYEFQSYYEKIASPFEWKFTRQDRRQAIGRVEASPRSGNGSLTASNTSPNYGQH